MNPSVASGPAWARRVAVLFVGGAFIGLAGLVLGVVFEDNTARQLSARAQTEAQLRAASLRTELEQLRDFPTILADDPDVRSSLDAAASSTEAKQLSLRLEQLTTRTRARIIYVIAENGLTLSSSNWRTPETFVGQNYSFRPYFREALANAEAEFFALGTVTRETGLYIARRVTSPQGRRGVVVVKMLFDGIEGQWAKGSDRIIVIDENGVAILSTDARWRFRATRAIPEPVALTIRQTRQFGEAPDLTPLPISSADQNEFAFASTPVPNSDWTLQLLAPVRQARASAAILGRTIGTLAAALIFGLTLFAYNSVQRSRNERRNQEQARSELERQVTDRTRDLQASNHQLQNEISDRKRVETNLQLLQDELIQANRLAVLGQITAGVAHEINQPLAAIRTLSDSAAQLIDRRQPREASENLATISDLVSRIASITDELRSMSRKGNGPPERVRLVDAIEGALLLVSARVRASGVNIERQYTMPDLYVVAHRMRIEQVVLNLLQNALDASSESSEPSIRICVLREGENALVLVEDNGPGLAPAAIDKLFTPFHTTKPQGMGLGLVISQDICREYGGQLSASLSDLGGAAFTVRLQVAQHV